MITTKSVEYNSFYHVGLTDSSIIEYISDYIGFYELQPNKTVVNVFFKKGGKREIIVIDQSDIDLTHNVFTPSFYTVIDNVLILIYSDIDVFISNPHIMKEISAVMNKRNINLENDSKLLTHPPIWKIVKCEENIIVHKEKIPIEVDDIPCGYKLIRNKNWELTLIKED